jgi:LysM repeat protein
MRRLAVVLLAACGLSARLFAQTPCPPSSAAAVPQSPVNVNVAPNTTINYSWSATTASGVTGYQVIVDGSTTACVTPNTSCSVSGLPVGQHTWIVRAIFASCNLDSTAKSFTAGCPTTAPNLQSPSNGATNVSLQPTLTWSAVTNADSYDISWSKSGAGGCSGAGNLATSTTTSFNPPPLQAGTGYEWRVVAKRSGSTCPNLPSTCFAFTTIAAACNAPGSFTLLSPSNNDTTTTTPLLSWTSASGADKYVIHLGTTNPPSPTANDPVVSASQTTYHPTLAAGTYYWYVDAYPSCSTTPKTSSSINSFKVVACPTAAPTLVSPSSGAQVTTASVTFQWAAVTSATNYDVEISDDGGATFSSIAVVSTNSVTKALSNGSYVWFVRALYGTVCPAVASGRSSFSVLTTTSNCLAPQLNAPANGATNVASPVTFDWKDVDGATSYRLLAAFNDGSPTLLAVTTDSNSSGNVPGGKVEWWVEASGPSCSSTSPHFIFSAIDNSGCPSNPGTASPVAPAKDANVASPVTFQWSAVAGASSYRVWASLSTDTSNSRVVLGTTTSTQLTVNVPQAKVEWLVEARFDNCPSTFSSPSSFTVTTATTCNNAPPTLVSPANGATNVTSPVEFKWNEVLGATKYTLFLGSDSAGETTDHELTRIVPAGTTSWYVVASFAGCPDVKSSVFTFNIPASTSCNGTVSILQPAAGATLPSPVNFQWTTLPGAVSYRVWASFNGGPPAVIARSTDGSANGVRLPAGTIEFRVEAVFGTCNVFSPYRSFTVQSGANCGANQPVTLKAPAAGATLTSEEVDFSWNATPGAALYRVWVSTNGDPFVDVGTTTDIKLHEDIAPGPSVWYVETFFEGCTPLASARSSFTVSVSTAKCSGDAPMIVSPADGATNVAAPVTLVWSAVANAEEYRVFASLGGGDFNVIEKTGDTSTSKRLPPGLVAWFVEAVSDECPGTRSTVAHFTVRQSANCPATPPQLVSPADGATNVAPPVRLDWNAVSGAIGYVVFVSHDDGAPTAVAETTETHFEHPFPPGEIDWWVIALFNGCPPLESRHFEFNIPEAENCSRTVKPLLQSPPDSATPIASPVHFEWSHVPAVQKYKVWAAIAGGGASVIGTTSNDHLDVDIPSGVVIWFVEGDFLVCPPVFSTPGTFVVRKSAPACATPDRPTAKAPAQVASATPYNVRWTPVANATTFELEESLTAEFGSPLTQQITGLSATLQHTIVSQPTRFYYRVRAVSDCDESKSHYSKIVTVVVLPPAANTTRHTSAEVGVRSGITQKVVLPGQNPPTTFTARGDKPWISVTPASGPIGPDGVTLTVTFDPAALALGTNTGTLLITYGTAGKTGGNATSSGGVPVSVSLVTPVQPGGKNGPLPDSLIVPAIGHAAGANNSLFESDLRIANVSAQAMKYLLNFTLSNTDGTQSGQSTTIQVDPGATMALDDILANFFGIGADGGGATGTLEIRPLTTSTTSTLGTTAKTAFQTVASSRTYNTTPTGTFGQFIPAIPYSQFIGAGGGRISLQQVAQSAAYRTNFGIVEASGAKADVLVHVFDNSGNEVSAPIPISLLAGEHKQINAFLAANNISLTDGRLEVEVTSATGKVTAYASTVDNFTNDPLLVLPVLKGALTASRYVVPGIADLNNGFASWRSDMRIFNGGANAVNVTLAYVAQPGNSGTPQTFSFPLNPGEVHAVDNALQSLFGLTNSGGAVVITTDTPSSLVATARTYNQTENGTYGQFIPGVSPAESVGLGDRTLQVLQLESSTRFRTNIGVTETNGKEVTVLVTAIPSDSKIAASTTLTLAPNEFRQFSLDNFNLGTLYNARVTVKVTGGSGKVTAYGSVIDQQTQDPTYVLAQ